MSWTVPGYRAEELVGFGASGEVWRGVAEANSDAVALKRLRVGAGALERDLLTREAALLTALRHEHLLRLHEVVQSGDDVVLVLDLARGGSLGGLLARRGRLLAGEVVTALAPVADALALAHAHGIVHGDVSPGNILLTADGRPLLADLGTARLLGQEPAAVRSTPGCTDPAVASGALPAPPSDVFALAAVAVAALIGAPSADHAAPGPSPAEVAALLTEAGEPSAMTDLLVRCLDPVPGRRPSADTVARTLLAAVPALPVRSVRTGAALHPVALTHPVAGRARPPAPPTPGRHRADGPQRRVAAPLVVAAALVLVVLAAVVGVLWGGAGEPAQLAADSRTSGRAATAARPTPSAGTPSTPASWSAVLDRLDRRRSLAFAQADPAVLEQVYASGSPALPADEAAVHRLRQRHEHGRGVRHHLTDVRVVRASADRTLLAVQDRLTGYSVLDADGRVVQRTPAGPVRSLRITLVRQDGRWLIETLAQP